MAKAKTKKKAAKRTAAKKVTTPRKKVVIPNGDGFVVITPDMARELMDRPGINRGVRRTHVAGLADVVDRGDWMSDLAPILLREDGSVVDGQHRLLAIIRSGKALKMLVIHGITDAQVYEQAMNTRPQSAQDRIVRLGGFDVPPRQRQVAACFCRLLLNHRDKRTIDVGTVETINRWRNVLKAVVGLAHPKRRGIHSSGVLAGFAYAVVAQPKSKSQVLGILSKWGTGDGLPKGLRKWRDHLMSATTGRGGSVADINTVQTAALLIRAIAGQCTTMTWQLSPLQLPGYERLSGMLEKAVTADQRARNGKATK